MSLPGCSAATWENVCVPVNVNGVIAPKFKNVAMGVIWVRVILNVSPSGIVYKAKAKKMSTTETKTIETNTFNHSSEIEWEVVGDGVRRKILCYDPNMMMVKVEFETGGIGSLHKHPHIQMSLVEYGQFEVEVDGIKRILNAGDVFYVHSNLVHGVVCLEKGALIDMFNPMREDFVHLG